jgi:hypothetical protein
MWLACIEPDNSTRKRVPAACTVSAMTPMKRPLAIGHRCWSRRRCDRVRPSVQMPRRLSAVGSSTTSGPNWHTNNAELYVGSTTPDSLMLNTMPIAAKDQIGLLKDFKFVKAADDKILLVDPATRKIVDTVTKEDAQ